ncbi:acyl-CoA-binding domain-containing protein 6 [Leptidea sinapis]|uniref:Acyl-CoA-binding domain-containing protein 6 n=1 Tax=Leptidea sinapis TaxID=189913 RepID=A0A5E4QA42_9NEOP|nr:acyl-CoA-binding domain-containing protein 6 [Leptidea sinapis]VVC94103.1 unnamed protein product [Leptidea sinapis]
MAEALPENNSNSDFSDDEQSPLDTSFTKATDHVRKLTSKLDNNQLLELYGLFKQATEGECNTQKPGWFDTKGRKKWEAWKSFGDLSSELAKQKYIDLVKKYEPSLELDESGPKQAWVAVSSLQQHPEPELVHNQLSLLEAARENLVFLIIELLEKNPDLKYEKDEDGLTALHWAADRDAVDALEALIKSGCDINAIDNSGQTALHYAASCGHVNSSKLLVKAGASLFEDNDGCTPLDVAADNDIRKILNTAD